MRGHEFYFFRAGSDKLTNHQDDTLSDVTPTPSSSAQNASSIPKDDTANPPTERPKRQRPAIPTLTVPPAPPPKRIQAGYAREAKAKQARKPAHTAPSAQVPPAKAARTATPPPSAAADPSALPYFIQRVRPSGQLPIYHDVKAGNTLRQTRIRKIAGDAHALRRELQAFLGIQKDKDCAVSAVTGHIVLKGHWRSEVDRFLVAKGF